MTVVDVSLINDLLKVVWEANYSCSRAAGYPESSVEALNQTWGDDGSTCPPRWTS